MRTSRILTIVLTAMSAVALVPGAANAAPAGARTAQGGAVVPFDAAMARGSATAPSAGLAQRAGSCGVRVDFPHASFTTSEQIHTRVESYCSIAYVSSNQVSGTTYRSRWYGWESRGSASAGPRATQSLRITVVVGCAAGDWYRYRTTARGYATLNGQSYTAAAYEENNSEIVCVRR